MVLYETKRVVLFVLWNDSKTNRNEGDEWRNSSNPGN